MEQQTKEISYLLNVLIKSINKFELSQQIKISEILSENGNFEISNNILLKIYFSYLRKIKNNDFENFILMGQLAKKNPEYKTI